MAKVRRRPMTLSERMTCIRSKNTTPEMTVRKLLHGMGYRYRLHVSILPGSPDLVFPGRRKVIFVHGCFWHQHPGCRHAHLPQANIDYWHRKLARNVARDAEATRSLGETGWDVLMVWECETVDLALLRKQLVSFLGDKRLGRPKLGKGK